MSDPDPHARGARRQNLAVVAREWGRIGSIGFGGPPTHIKLLRELCVERKCWLTPVEFEDAVAACNLLPGPASTQLAIFCAWRVRGRRGALLGGAAFIVPGLILVLALSALFLTGAPPRAVLAAGAGAGSAVAAVAVHAAAGLLPASWHRARDGGRASRLRWAGYVAAGPARGGHHRALAGAGVGGLRRYRDHQPHAPRHHRADRDRADVRCWPSAHSSSACSPP